jgi:hypothetical protein
LLVLVVGLVAASASSSCVASCRRKPRLLRRRWRTARSGTASSPTPLHPVGDVYLLTTSQVEKQVGQLREWPDRLETGHVGTPLRWKQPAGAVTLALNLDPTGPNDSTVDERQPAEVVEGRPTSVLVAASDVTPAACPVAPTEMSTPTP